MTIIFLPICVSTLFLKQASMIMINDPNSLFSFPSFNPDSCKNGDLLCMGIVSVGNSTSSGHYLNLTLEPPNGSSNLLVAPNAIGLVYPVLAWLAMISTSFTVKDFSLPQLKWFRRWDDICYYSEKYHGLLNGSTQGGVVQQLAVELDTSMNAFDVDGNHIGIIRTSIISPVVEKSLNSTGIDLKSGRDIKVKIDYDGSNQMLSVSLGYSENPLVSFLNLSIPISVIVARSVYVGFTAFTGTLLEILYWFFTSVPLSFETEPKTEDNIKSLYSYI